MHHNKFLLIILSLAAGVRDELVLRASCSPASALVQLDQYLFQFLLSFAREFLNPDSWQTVEDETEEEVEDWETIDMPAESGFLVYVERCHIAGFALTVSYTPAYVNMQSLREGNFRELLNMVAKSEAFNLWLQDLEICGADSLSTLLTVAATRWVQEVLAFQMRSFSISVPGGATVPIGKIGKTLTDFAAQPVSPSKETFKQLKKAIIELLRLLADQGVLKKK